MIRVLRIFLLLFCLCSWVQAEVLIPPLQQRVTDLTGTLSEQQRQTLEQLLAQLEAQKGAQLAILLLPSTQPESIEQYSMRVAEAWKLGRKGVDDGVLVLVAKNDRAMRIEVGYGLEGALTDATSKRIIAEVMTPYFKRDDFYGGLMQGTASLIGVINGEALPAASSAPHGSDSKPSGAMDALFIGVVIASVVGAFLRMLMGRLPAAMLTGGGIAVFGVFSGLSIMLSLLAALGCFILVLAGVTLGGGSGHGGGGGGGFSGGGGGFGGGGASGRW